MVKLIISCLEIHEYPSHPVIYLKYVSTRQNIEMEKIYWQKNPMNNFSKFAILHLFKWSEVLKSEYFIEIE